MTRIVIARPLLHLPYRLQRQIEDEKTHAQFRKQFWKAIVLGLFTMVCGAVSLKLAFTGHRDLATGVAMLASLPVSWLVSQAGLRYAPDRKEAESISDERVIVIPRLD